MWSATTSFSDGILVVAFATVIFLLLLGSVVIVRWLFRIVTAKADPESVILVFRDDFLDDEDEGTEDPSDDFGNFLWFLHSKLREKQAGYFVDSERYGGEFMPRFKGADSNGIWRTIEADVRDKAPRQPLRVILEGSKKSGGRRIIDAVAWKPDGIPLPQPELPIVPEAWIRLSTYGNLLTIIGIAGLFFWKVFRKSLGLSEDEFRATVLGNSSAWIIGILLIVGLTMKWYSSVRIRSLSRQAGVLSSESATSSVLKYVLLLVICIFGLVFVFCV